ncbi:hypothetical protein ABT337_17780 [Saccharopolyspora hirsuta]|uniref:hypothetical protein n=1 Tax=Saccharopolyspora hirsuta TaxID=1837 RepID=UPI00332D8E7E
MPDEFGVDQAGLEAIASSLRTSTANLGAAGANAAASADAGESTPDVSEAVSALLGAAAAIAAGAEQSGNDVAASHATYNQTDSTAAEELPPLPLPTNNTSPTTPLPWGN